MKIFKLSGLILAFLSISNCSVLTEADQELTGRIGFGVFSLAFSRDSGSHGRSLAVRVYLKHEESGIIHKVNIQFKAGSRIVFLDNLKPGNYTVSEYSSVYGYATSFKTTLSLALNVKVIGNQTTLFPQVVTMSEIYPSGGLKLMDDKDYWQSLINIESNHLIEVPYK